MCSSADSYFKTHKSFYASQKKHWISTKSRWRKKLREETNRENKSHLKWLRYARARNIFWIFKLSVTVMVVVVPALYWPRARKPRFMMLGGKHGYHWYQVRCKWYICVRYKWYHFVSKWRTKKVPHICMFGELYDRFWNSLVVLFFAFKRSYRRFLFNSLIPLFSDFFCE